MDVRVLTQDAHLDQKIQVRNLPSCPLMRVKEFWLIERTI